MIRDVGETIIKRLGISPSELKLYNASFRLIGQTQLGMISASGTSYVAVSGEGPCFEDFTGDLIEPALKLCPLSHENRLMLNKYLIYTVPIAFGPAVTTFGAGDRLGLATAGLLGIIAGSLAKPILAQQSKRELELTNRTLSDVLDCAAYAVFQEGYQGGFGADGDHLKNKTDILNALDNGYTMITLDCSEKIGREIDKLSDSEAEEKYLMLPLKTRQELERKYLGVSYSFNGFDLIFAKQELIKSALIYFEAIEFMISIYKDCIEKSDHPVDFEISLDETESTTSEYGHLFVASQIVSAGVKITSLAPRFIGEFQKGIDYIGDIEEFEHQLSRHATIADFFGYKLSIHSGSDKFSVFPLIGQYTKGRLHLKVSGTNWLEAIATIALCDPTLYRAIHRCSLLHFMEAREFYHVSADLNKVRDLNTVSDSNLIDYLSEKDARQLLHITYGFVLRDPKLKDAIYKTLRRSSPVYIGRLERHIGRHLSFLGLLKDIGETNANKK